MFSTECLEFLFCTVYMYGSIVKWAGGGGGGGESADKQAPPPKKKKSFDWGWGNWDNPPTPSTATT